MTYKIGDTVNAEITGIAAYGAFALLDDGSTGLIHISEISDDFVVNVRYFLKVGEKVDLKVIDLDKEKGQYRLSLKALRPHKRSRNWYYDRKNQLPKNDIGFRSLEVKLPEWIEEKEKENG